MENLRIDLFCKIVDNFGDIGVCWRLAKQLQREHMLNVRLWVDDLRVAKKLIAGLNIELEHQEIDGITICNWSEENIACDVADIVIEAFACELPAQYLQAMKLKPPVWLNLEYLSAENWVGEYHAQVSIHPLLGLKKYFYFPGFSENTGGLIRENYLQSERLAFQESDEEQSDFLKKIGVERNPDALLVSLFCYAHAPLKSLLDAMQDAERPVHLLVPEGLSHEAINDFFESTSHQMGDHKTKNQLSIQIIPFLNQENYDQLLWTCDLNFVRGEDSWIRALWAGKAFIWQPYKQEENTHLIKLQAFLDEYATDELTFQQAHHAWSTSGFTHALWDTFSNEITALNQHATEQTARFEKQDDLASKLVIFCKNLL